MVELLFLLPSEITIDIQCLLYISENVNYSLNTIIANLPNFWLLDRAISHTNSDCCIQKCIQNQSYFAHEFDLKNS